MCNTFISILWSASRLIGFIGWHHFLFHTSWTVRSTVSNVMVLLLLARSLSAPTCVGRCVSHALKSEAFICYYRAPQRHKGNVIKPWRFTPDGPISFDVTSYNSRKAKVQLIFFTLCEIYCHNDTASWAQILFYSFLVRWAVWWLNALHWMAGQMLHPQMP